MSIELILDIALLVTGLCLAVSGYWLIKSLSDLDMSAEEA